MTAPLIQNLSDMLGNLNSSVVVLPRIAVPFTTITNRAQMVDSSNDLAPKYGNARVCIEALNEVQGETGPNGERVWKPFNDQFDHVRFVGQWSNNYGQPYVSANTTSDYIEITFYGVGLNLLFGYLDTNNRGFSYSVDGGSTSNVSLTSASITFNNRNYMNNFIAPVVSGLSLGFHTVKITMNQVIQQVLGYEVANTALSLVGGTSYAAGKKLYQASLVSDTYNTNFESGTLGTKGGHVVVYQKSNGVVAKAVNPVDATALYGTSASHSNETLVRSISPREFGAGRSDDFSRISASTINAAFTLDDNVTSLKCSNANFVTNNGIEAVQASGSSQTLEITFIGTGLDVLISNDSGSRTDSISVDGVSQGSISVTANQLSIIKICSGLPYGSHTVSFTSGASAASTYYARFLIYATKAPTVPTGAVQLAEYYVMANFNSAVYTGSPDIIGSGVLAKGTLREVTYFGGSNWAPSLNLVASSTGLYASRTFDTSSWSHTFFGTGIVIFAVNQSGSGTEDFTVTIDGSLNATGTPLNSCTNVGGGTYRNSSAGILAFTGLTLGYHTITATRVSGALLTGLGRLDIITPIHSPKSNGPGDYQNALTVGSQGIGDLRPFSTQTIKSLSNWSEAFGITISPTTNVVAFVPIPDMSCTIKTSGNPIEVFFNASVNQNSTSYTSQYNVLVDGVLSQVFASARYNVAAGYEVVSFHAIIPVGPGVHKVDMTWWSENTSMTLTALGQRRYMTVREIN